MANTDETNPAVLIVAAGAMGLIIGYHLSLAGARVTFLVRPRRAEAMRAPQLLYSYDDHTLKSFDAYDVITDPRDAAGLVYDFVFVTLDGATVREPEGADTLAAIGDAVRRSEAVVITGGVGADLRAHYLATMRLPEPRVINGGLSMLSHQVQGVDMPVHAPTDAALLARAQIAYRHVGPASIILGDRFAEPAARFAAIYGASGVSQCAILSEPIFGMMTKRLFPVFAAAEICGWPRSVAALASYEALWQLVTDAVREIQALDEHGEEGKAASAQLTPDGLKAMLEAVEAAAMPLGWQDFNRFHHGAKVARQDTDLLRACAEKGQREGKAMTSLRALLAQLDSFRSAQG